VNPTPKTIQIYLPGGNPQGIRIAEITTRIVQVIEVPRSLVQDFLKMPESGQVALYFLFGNAEDRADPKVYIGQTGDLRARLMNHNQKKDFWQRALVLISRTNSLTQTHALFLEWHSLQAARKAERYADENGNSGSKPHTPAPLEADCLEIFETGRTLLATLGYPVFDPVAGAAPKIGGRTLFTCKSAGINASGVYTSEGFVVLKGSVGRAESVPSLGIGPEKVRNDLLAKGICELVGQTIVFTKDHLFGTPSGAAITLLGRRSNGWTEWKAPDGRTLDELERQVPGEDP
jgi:predicted GIY-YIG superfamily endonuclease